MRLQQPVRGAGPITRPSRTAGRSCRLPPRPRGMIRDFPRERADQPRERRGRAEIDRLLQIVGGAVVPLLRPRRVDLAPPAIQARSRPSAPARESPA